MFFKPFFIALSTYSIVPVPQFEWTEDNLRYSICFFPLVGLLCGGALTGWLAFCSALDIGRILCAAVAVCIPLLLSGGIHMDGYMDTVDALASHQPREKKLAILKDPNSGAFAVAYCGVYLVLCFGLMYELLDTGLLIAVCPGFVLSRALSGLCAVTLPNARGSGMLNSYTQKARKKLASAVMIAFAVLASAVMTALAPLPGLLAAVLSVLWVFLYRRMVMRQFGGVTGDTAGFFLQVCELAVLLGIWMGGLLP